MYEQIITLHDTIRAYIERQEPEFRVTRIEGESMTEYEAPRHALAERPEFILTFTSLSFRVRGEDREWGPLREFSCKVLIANSGQMFIEGRAIRQPSSSLYARKRREQKKEL